MIALYVINMCAAIAMLLWPLWFSRRKLKLSWINPFTIVMTTALPVDLMKLLGGPSFLIEDGLFNPYFQFALLMGTLLLLCQTAGLVLFFNLFKNFRIDKSLPFQRVILSRISLTRAARFFLVIYFLALYLLASTEFGIGNWLANPREGYQLHRTGAGHWYALSITALAISFLLAFLARPSTARLIITTMFYIAMGYFLGSKGILLSIFTSMLIFLWFLKSPMLKKIIIFGMPIIFGLMLWNLALAMTEGVDMQTILEYFDYYKNAADYYQAYFADQLPLFHGQVLLGSFWSYVPRGFFPDKPVTYGILLINEYFYPGQAELTNTPAFGGAVAEFSDFGIIGVIIFGVFSAQSMLTAATSYLIYRKPGLNFAKVSMATVMLMLIQYAPGFGTFFPGGLYFVLLCVVLLIIGALRSTRTRIKKHTRAAIDVTPGAVPRALPDNSVLTPRGPNR